MKNANCDRRWFLKNSAKFVAGATVAASIPQKSVTARSDGYSVFDHSLEQTDDCEPDFEFNNWDSSLHCEPK